MLRFVVRTSNSHFRTHLTRLKPISTLFASHHNNDSINPFSSSSLPNNLETSSPNSTQINPGSHVSLCRKENEDCVDTRSLVISHPWPEWIALLKVLVKEGYFGEDKDFLFGNKELGLKECNVIRSACLNFSRDRNDTMRRLSREDVRVIAECGCPSTDRKVVNSEKRLRKSLGIDEENVCSSCNLRGNCDRAFVKPREDEDGRTVDVMRVLLTYALDPIIDVVENKPCLNKKVQESVRLLLKQLTECESESLGTFPFDDPGAGITSSSLSMCQDDDGNVKMKPGDWLCPKCNFLNFARNIKCLQCEAFSEEKLRKLREDQEHLPLKKGDWICDQCNLINFARNTRCFVCKAKPPRRHLGPGEWECESCNYINFRRNAACLKCDHKRPKVLNSSSTSLPPPGNVVEGVSFGSVVERYSERAVAPKWRFTKEVCDVQEKPVQNITSGVFDFPIVGGNSDLSRDPGCREVWKLEMQQMMRKMDARNRSNATNEKPQSSGITKDLLTMNSDDDEDEDDDEISGWFANRQR